MDSHTAGIYGVLLAVVAVGVVGLYFTTMMAGEPSVIYVGGANTPPTVTAYMPPFYAKIAEISKPFTVRGYGITGMDTMKQGTGTINGSYMPDLRMPKNWIHCSAEILQGNDSATFYTCNDNASVGGTITCDNGGTTNYTTCSSTQTDGAFLVCNHGQAMSLNATLTNLTLGNVTNYNIWLDDILYNAIDNDVVNGNITGCIDACNLCNKTSADAGNCDKSMNSTLGSNETIGECKFFDTSGQCVCECFSIHIDNEDDVHQLKNGAQLVFEIRKSVEESRPLYNSSADC